MLENEKIHSDRRSRASSPSLPSLSTSSDVSSIHARSTPKIAACIIVTVLAVASIIGIAFYLVTTESPLRSDSIGNDKIASSQPQFISFDEQKRIEKTKNITTKSFDDDNIPIVPYFETPILRNPIRTKYTDGQDPEGPLQEKHGIYYKNSEGTTSTNPPNPPHIIQRQFHQYIQSTWPPSFTVSSTIESVTPSKRSKYFLQPTQLSQREFQPFNPNSNLNRGNHSDFGARRRGFIRENINNPYIRRQTGYESISTLMDRRPGRPPFPPNGPFTESSETNYNFTIDQKYRSDNNGLPRDGTEGNRELHKGLINNIYQLVDTAQTEVNSSLRKNARASLPSHTSVRVPHGPSKPIQEQVNHGEHPESIFARFISKFRDRLTQNGPWAESEIPDIVQGRDFDHHSTSSLLFISLGILIMNALTQAPRDDGTPIEEEKDRAFHPSLLELESLFEGMKEESFAPHNSSLTFSKYVKLVESLKKMKDSDKPIGVDCIWQKYCTELNSNSYSEDSILKFIARLNSVGMKLIMSQIDGYELFTEFARSYQNWQPLPCKDIFKLCDKDKLSGLDKDLL